MVAMRALTVACVLLLMPAAPAGAQDADSRAFAAARDCTGLTNYLSAFPEGRYRAAAESRRGECVAPKPVSKEKPKPPAAPPPASVIASAPVDPCIQTRADWGTTRDNKDVGVLRAFLAHAPAACVVQRAQAQAVIDRLLSIEYDAKRVKWNGVPEFDGEWVLQPGAPAGGCGNLPWRYEPRGQLIRRVYPNGGYRDMKVIATSPPTLRVDQNNRGAAIIEGQRQKIINQDGKLDCYLVRRQ